jgi:hypothetical protein
MKKKILSLAILLLIGSSLVGCGEASQSASNQSNNQQTNSNVISNSNSATNPGNTSTNSTNANGVVDGQKVEMEKLGDIFLESAYDRKGYESESYAGISTASYTKQILKIQREILEQEKQQTDLLKKIEANTR